MDFLPYIEFSSLFVLHNRLARELDSRMRHCGISATGFLALTEIWQGQQQHRSRATRASLARRLGTNASSMSILVARLIKNGLVTQQLVGFKSYELLLTKAGRSAMHGGAAAWEAVFEEASAHLSDAKKRYMLQGASQIMEGFIEDTRKERHERNMRLVRKHKTRGIMIESENRRLSNRKTSAD